MTVDGLPRTLTTLIGNLSAKILRVKQKFNLLSKRIFSGKPRFALPILVVGFSKIFGAIWLYRRLSISGEFHTPWMNDPFFLDSQKPNMDWLYLFLGWDSGWYSFIVHTGYRSVTSVTHSDPWRLGLCYAFFPGYPFVIYVINLVLNNIVLSEVVCSLVFGMAWVPFFQAIAEKYMSRPEALGCTLIMAFVPHIFLFTTVAYSESLFLFACVSSWYFYQKNKIAQASLLAALATITRTLGIFFVLPMFLDLLLHRKWKHLLYTFIPALTLFGWLFYCFLMTGDWLAFRTAQFTIWKQQGWLSTWVIPFLTGLDVKFDVFTLGFIVLVGYLIYRSWENDWRLALFAAIYFLSTIYFAHIGSYTRYLAFVFPIWLNIRTKNVVGITIICTFFFVQALMLWYGFLTHEWVG